MELFSLLVEWLAVLVYEAYVDAFMYVGAISLATALALSILYLRFYD